MDLLTGVAAGGLFVYIMQKLQGTDDGEDKYDLLMTKNPESFSSSLKNILEIVTVSGETAPVGSYNFRVHKYPSDVDIMEKLRGCCGKDKAIEKITRDIQKLAAKIKNTKGVYFADFKAGVDEEFILDIGKVEEGVVTGYNSSAAKQKLTAQLKSGLLTDKEFNKIYGMMSENISPENWEKLHDVLRKYYLLRWNLNELIRDEKIIRGKTVKLKDMLSKKGIVKIDIWAPINGRYTEVTNYFLLYEVDEKGVQKAINFDPTDLMGRLKGDIRLYSSKDHFKAMKLAKRMWSAAMHMKDLKMAEKITPLLSSDAAILNQIASESEVLRLMLQKLSSPPIDVIVNQIDGFKSRMSTVYTIKLNEKLIYDAYDTIVASRGDMDRNAICMILEIVEKLLQKGISSYAETFLKINNLIPVPANYLR